jgi:hypothetical protein
MVPVPGGPVDHTTKLYHPCTVARLRAISAVLVRVQSHHSLLVGGRRNQPTASTNTKVAKSRASNRRG